MTLERLRKEKNLTQSTLASMLNVTQGTISMIESGERKPSFDLLVKLAKALDVSIDDLIEKEVG